MLNGGAICAAALEQWIHRPDRITTAVTPEPHAFLFGHHLEVIALHAIRASDGIWPSLWVTIPPNTRMMTRALWLQRWSLNMANYEQVKRPQARAAGRRRFPTSRCRYRNSTGSDDAGHLQVRSVKAGSNSRSVERERAPFAHSLYPLDSFPEAQQGDAHRGKAALAGQRAGETPNTLHQSSLPEQ